MVQNHANWDVRLPKPIHKALAFRTISLPTSGLCWQYLPCTESLPLFSKLCCYSGHMRQFFNKNIGNKIWTKFMNNEIVFVIFAGFDYKREKDTWVIQFAFDMLLFHSRSGWSKWTSSHTNRSDFLKRVRWCWLNFAHSTFGYFGSRKRSPSRHY